ncbi:MAG: homoserine dehydrogenase [Candidatus Bathyarchaeia archaeon]
MRIVLVGFGVVGQAFARIMAEQGEALRYKYGLHPQVVAIADKGGAIVDPKGLFLSEALELKRTRGTIAAHETLGLPRVEALNIIKEVDADVLIEATPTNIKDGEPGLSHIQTALKLRRHVITTNKGPLALALPALMELADYNRVLLRFSGTVGAGTPILDFAKKCLIGDRILAVQGILNGTTNYILTRMSEEGVSFETCLAEAQRAGYAEADPSMDVDGYDSACKLVIIANYVMGIRATLKDVKIEGIRKVSTQDIQKAARLGRVLKLIASIDGDLKVQPMEIPRTSPLCVGGTLNAVTFTTRYSGEQTIIGRGAGGPETAVAILRDLLNIKGELLER